MINVVGLKRKIESLRYEPTNSLELDSFHQDAAQAAIALRRAIGIARISDMILC